jgi:ribosomal protein S18 acetylase RimI-like enzyme
MPKPSAYAVDLNMSDPAERVSSNPIWANPVWHALQTRHRHFAIRAGEACRYPADVSPFAAVATPTTGALRQLHSLLSPGESLWLEGGTFPFPPELIVEERTECLHMVLPEDAEPPDPAHTLVQLSSADAAEMVALTDIAFPGFFRPRTHEMGAYYGVRAAGGELIGMAGERLMPEGYPEISGVCTHPLHRGQGLATSLIGRLARDHRRDGLVSWLHVNVENHGAQELYRRIGFRTLRTVLVHRVTRKTRIP